MAVPFVGVGKHKVEAFKEEAIALEHLVLVGSHVVSQLG